MKFGENERKAFKKDLQQELIGLESKYGIKVTLLVRENDPNYFGLKIKEEAPKPQAQPKVTPKVPKPAPTKKASPKSLDDISLDDINLDDLDFSDLKSSTPKSQAQPKATPKESKPAPTKKASPKSLDDISLDDINLDDLDFSDLKTEKGSLNKEDLDDLDFDFDDEPKPAKKKSSRDDEDRYSQELQKYLGGSFADPNGGSFADPDNIFDEEGSGSDEFSDEDLDAYLAASGLFSYSFQAKLIQSNPSVQDYYTDVKNLLLSYDGMKSKVTWENDIFTFKGKEMAKIDIEGDKVELYLRLTYSDYDESNISCLSRDKKFKDLQSKITIDSMADVDSAYELIEDLTTENHIYPGEDRYDDYHFQYETNDELIARGLIRKK